MRQEYIVKEIENGWTLRKWARYHLPDLSYPALCTLARNKNIKINGKTAKMNDILVAGQQVVAHETAASIQLSKRLPDEINDPSCSQRECKIERNNTRTLAKTSSLEPIKHMIIYENDDFAIINKPINICTQGADDSIAAITNAFIVHRLDKTTSGLLILAKTKHAADAISSQIREHKFKKTYHAILLKPQKHISESGEQTQQQLTKQIWSQQIDGLNATTEYEIIKQNEQYMLVKLMPLTGRKHQLRIHAAQNGVPILGDTRYTSNKNAIANRIYLHCSKIEFTTDKSYVFECEHENDWPL